MKLHLPVRLFKFVLSLVTVMPVLSQAAYVKPTSITIPEDHTQVLVDAPEDIFIDDMMHRKFVYLMSKDITFADVSRRPAIGENGSWIFTSASVNNLVSLTFTENNVFLAGAIYGIEPSGSISMIGNADVCFSNSNSSGGWGGAFFLSDDSSLYLNNNENVSFSQNTIGSVNGGDTITYGGAVFMGKAGAVTMNGNKSVSFTGNSNITFASDEAWGGAICIYSGLLEMNDNESVIFRGNVIAGVEACGGAILGCNYGDTTLNIRNNDDVLFEKNAEITENEYRLRGVYLRWCCVGDVSADFSAPKGKKIEFRDSVCIEPQWSETHLNRDYTDAKGNIIKQTGDIIFTGKYTEAHLNELLTARKAGRKATNAEISNSRTSSINGSLTLYGGRLRIEDGAVLNVENVTVKFGNAPVIQLKNAQLNSSQLTFESGTTLRVQNSASVSGYLTFSNGSNLAFVVPGNDTGKAVLTMESGRISLTGNLKVSVSDSGILRDKNTYVLVSGVSKPSNWDEKVAYTLPDSAASSSSLYWEDSSLLFYFEQLSSTWNNSAGNRRWDFTSLNWIDDGNRLLYRNSVAVTFGNGGAGAVTLVGTLTPYSVTVNNGSGYDYTWQGSGKLSGAMKLYKKGAGTLTIKNTNTFTGGTEITGGKVVLNAENALGTGAISVSGAELSATSRINAQGLTLKNSKMTQTGGGTGLTLKGSMTMENSDLVLKAPLNGTFLTMTKGSSINMLDSCTRNITLSGTLNATDSDITMYGHTQTNNLTLKNSSYTSVGGAARDLKVTNTLSLSSGAKLRHHGAIHAKSVSLNGSNITQTGGGKGLNLSGALSMSNKSTVSLKGPLTASSVTLAGSSVLDSVDQYSRQVTLSGSMSATDSTVKLYGNVEMNALTLKNAVFDMDGKYTRSLTLKSGSTFTNSKADLYGFLTGTNLTLNNSTLNQRGGSAGLQLSGALSMSNNAVLNLKSPLKAASANLSSGAKLNMQDSVTRAITLTGSMSATKATVNHYGKLKAANLTLTDSTYNGTGRYATGMDISGTTKLTNSKLDIYGYLNSKNLTLSKGRVRQSGTGNVTISGTLSMNSGSSLTTSGTLSAGTMTLSGGTINLTAGSLKTITVNNTLTLNSAIDLNLGCSLKQGVSYKLVSFKKTNLTKTSNLASLLGMSGSGATLTLGSNSITLKVTNSTAWNKYVAANKKLFSSSTTAIMPEVEEEEEIVTTSVAETTEAVAAFDRSGADALVQSNWGMLNASRAFTDTIGNRTSNRRALGEEQKSSVWMSAMGASSRLSSDGVAAGSDYNLFGAAFGMEQQLTEKSSLGLAIGNSRGKVSSFTSGRTKQDTLHTALYGQHLLQQSTSDALTLDWSAAYGRTESRWNGMEWDQRALQLDARATYAHQLNDKTTVSAFAGLQYYASDSATVAKGCESGSIQNLRGEIGVGIGHRATSKTSIYGELSFVGDMARNNPTATIGEYRVRGANPGRAGINLSAGVNHALNEKWSVNASYNMELMERANSHSANIGASYKF